MLIRGWATASELRGLGKGYFDNLPAWFSVAGFGNRGRQRWQGSQEQTKPLPRLLSSGNLSLSQVIGALRVLGWQLRGWCLVPYTYYNHNCMNPATEKFLKDGKAIFLAYDQGFEHGPTDFSDDLENYDPSKIVEIAKDSQVFTAIIFHEGVAQKYYPIGGLDAQSLPPLLLKLNGKTSFHKDEEPYSPQLCSVSEAKRIGALGVGYTVYIGSEHEAKMMEEFSRIEDEAHEAGLVVTMWAYPRGKHVAGKETDKDTVAYGTRIALEMGADFVKVPYTGDTESFSWVVKTAGKTKVLIQGGSKKTEEELFAEIKGAMAAGAAGVAVGRNVWQNPDPVGMAQKIKEVVYGKS